MIVGMKFFYTILITVMIAHLLNCPYSKVEESFNMQAMHDILYHGFNISKYDHMEYPGVVPRTFIGPLVVSGLSYPAAKIFEYANVPKIYMQLVCRSMLGLLVCYSFMKFISSISKRINPTVAKLSVVLTITQFHFLFYASRSLPNTFALVIVLHALSSWILHQNKRFIWFSGAVIIIFRSELCILLGLLLLVKLINGKITIFETIVQCIIAAPVILASTVLIDSFFWQRWLWPEGEVLYYNTVLNKSSHWGTMPYWWYFYSAIPRVMMFTLLLVPFGLYQKQDSLMTKLNMLSILYVLLYSFLPHKELRFIIYIFPVLNVAAAVGAINIVRWCRNYINMRRLTVASITILIGANTFPAILVAHISSLNYAGGNAFSFLHSLNENMQNDRLSIHVCDAAAQTGVTRFGELNPNWSYSKDEDYVFDVANEYRSPYSLLLLEGSCPPTKRYETQAVINGFAGWKLLKRLPFLEIRKETKICILKGRGLR